MAYSMKFIISLTTLTLLLPCVLAQVGPAAIGIPMGMDLQQVLIKLGEVQRNAKDIRYGIENVLSPSLLQASSSLLKLKEGDLGTVNQVRKVLEGASLYNVSGQCLNDTETLLDDLIAGQSYAFKFIDAAGKLPSGISEGALVWLGSYEQCLKISSTSNVTSFTGRYCTNYFPFQYPSAGATPVYLLVGVCVPSSCDQTSTVGLVNTLLSLVEFGKPKPLVDGAAFCKGPQNLDGGAIAALCVVGLVLLFVAMGTLYEIVGYFKAVTAEHCALDVQNATEDENKGLITGAVKIQSPANTQNGLCSRFFLSFSSITNGHKILNVDSQRKDIRCLHGIRVLSMWWVILGHTHVFPTVVFMYDNLGDMLDVVTRFSFQAIGNATVSVDTFFFLSGLLVTYLLYKELKDKQGKVNWALLYFHRFWRLTPAYMFVLMVFTALTKYIYSGPIASAAFEQRSPCIDYWWTNLLYINNFYPVEGAKGCMAWAWYLANDMQFFLIAPIIIYILYRNRWLGSAVMFLLVIGCFICTGVLSTYYQCPVNAVGVAPINPNKTDNSFDVIYTKPYTRIAPYIVGMFTGYLLCISGCKKKDYVHPIFALIGWAVAALLCTIVLYGCYSYVGNPVPMNVHLAAFYNSTARFTWSVGLALVVLLCVHGYGGPINTILSWSFWVPISRLTYCAYLVHPVWIFIYILGSRQVFHYDDVSMVYMFIGNLVLSYAIAFGTSLVIEAPMMGLEKIIFKK